MIEDWEPPMLPRGFRFEAISYSIIHHCPHLVSLIIISTFIHTFIRRILLPCFIAGVKLSSIYGV